MITKGSPLLFRVVIGTIHISLISAFEPTCEFSNPLSATMCLAKYTEVKWDELFTVLTSAKSPSNIVLFKASDREQWTAQLRLACKPLIDVALCTEKYGGYRWWNCFDDDGMQGLMEQFGTAAGDLMPDTPGKVRILFGTIYDFCDPQLADDFDKNHPKCMRAVFDDTPSDVATYVRQVKNADDKVVRLCNYIDCPSATAYNNAFVYPIYSKCNKDSSDTAHRLANSFIRLAMTRWKTYCTPNQYSKDLSSYTAKPTVDPIKLLPTNSSSNCSPTITTKKTTTTKKPRTSKATTKKPKSAQARKATTKTPKRTQTTKATTEKPKRTQPTKALNTDSTTMTHRTTRGYFRDDYGFRILKEVVPDYYLVIFTDVGVSSSSTIPQRNGFLYFAIISILRLY